MSEKHLLLSPAKSLVLVVQQRGPGAWLRIAALTLGVFVVLLGAADLTARVARATLGEQAASLVFGPLVLHTSSRGVPESVVATSAFVPVRLKVPALGIDANVEQVGKKADGTMGTPQDFDDVAWYALGGKPGGEGSAVFAGHVNNARAMSGVFQHLSQIAVGDYITVSDEEGATLVYAVSRIETYPFDDAPVETIFASTGPAQLVLVTCEGEWVAGERTFAERLVVTAVPAYR